MEILLQLSCSNRIDLFPDQLYQNTNGNDYKANYGNYNHTLNWIMVRKSLQQNA